MQVRPRAQGSVHEHAERCVIYIRRRTRCEQGLSAVQPVAQGQRDWGVGRSGCMGMGGGSGGVKGGGGGGSIRTHVIAVIVIGTVTTTDER